MKKKTKTPSYEIIFGVHSLHEALRSKGRTCYKIYTLHPHPKALTALRTTIPRHVPITTTDRASLTRMAGTGEHQNIVALVSPLGTQKQCFSTDKSPFIVMVDGIQDPRNLGAILRSAYCTGAHGAVIPQKNCAPLSGATHKASAGLLEHLPLYRPATTSSAVNQLTRNGYSLYMAALGGTSALSCSYTPPLCLVIGNEAHGIAPSILAKADHTVTLPQREADISYNASVAAGILLFHASARNGYISVNH